MNRLAPLATALLLAAGCAPMHATDDASEKKKPAPHAAANTLPAWRLEELAAVDDQPMIPLRLASGEKFPISPARVRLMHDAARRVLAGADAGETPDLLLVGSPAINAFASYQSGQPVIAVTLGMTHLLGDDAGAWAALFGHELAHFRLGHHERLRQRKQATQIGSSIAGIALSIAGLGFGSVVADAGGTLVERAFSREDEHDADGAGFKYLRRAGFEGAGALRLQTKLLDAARTSTPGFLSTHPGGQERIDHLRGLIQAPAQ